MLCFKSGSLIINYFVYPTPGTCALNYFTERTQTNKQKWLYNIANYILLCLRKQTIISIIGSKAELQQTDILWRCQKGNKLVFGFLRKSTIAFYFPNTIFASFVLAYLDFICAGMVHGILDLHLLSIFRTK